MTHVHIEKDIYTKDTNTGVHTGVHTDAAHGAGLVQHEGHNLATGALGHVGDQHQHVEGHAHTHAHG